MAFQFVNESNSKVANLRSVYRRIGYRRKVRAHPKYYVREVPHHSAMASSPDNPQVVATATSPAPSNETARGRSVATRLTEAEFSEVEAAALGVGKKVAEWLRDAALAQARGGQVEEETDQILLAELMGMRSLMLNLFARASQGPLSTDDIKKMSAYSESIKDQRAVDFLAQRRQQNRVKKANDEL